MAQATKRQDRLRTLRSTLGGPVTSTVTIAGVLLMLLGAVLQTGVWAGMFGIIGGLLVLVAVASRLLIWVYQRS